MTTKPKLLLLADVRGWAFDQNLKDMAEYLGDEFDATIAYVVEFGPYHHRAPRFSQYDVVFAPYYRWGIERLLPWDRTLGSLRAQWLFPERRRPPEKEEFDFVNRYVAFHMVTAQNYEEYREHCPGVVSLTNPVNMRRFPEPTRVTDIVVAEWNGNARHDNLAREDVKGFMSIVQPACKAAGVPLAVAEYYTSRRSPEAMPSFYRQANVAVCASLYEGASSSTMEGMASGLALLATDVGNHREMRDSQLAQYGETGILLLERDVTTFTRVLMALRANSKRVARMGEINRMEIQRAWSWDVWEDRFAAFFRTPLAGKGDCHA